MIPPLFTVALLGRRVEVRAGPREETGVVVALHRSHGILVLAPVGERRADGTWRSARGVRWARRREEIERITVMDLDVPDLT